MTSDTIPYQNNIYRHIESIDRVFRQRLMSQAQIMGHQGLKLSYNQVLTFIGDDGIRVSDLAKLNGVSKQAMGQVVNEIEGLGYLTRVPDPSDKRAKIVLLSKQGKKLLVDAGKITKNIETEFAELIGDKDLQQLKGSLGKIYIGFGLSHGPSDLSSQDVRGSMLEYLEGLNRYVESRLMKECLQLGFPGLKLSYGLLLPHISREGIRINDLAEINQVSKQAIAQLADEVEAIGYIARQDDPRDKRAKRLVLTKKGNNLIQTGFETLSSVEKEACEYLNKNEIQTFLKNLRALNRCLNTQRDLTNGEIQQWITQLLQNKETIDSLDTGNKIKQKLSNKEIKQLKELLKKLT